MSVDEGDIIMKIQNDAISRVEELLDKKSVKKNDSDIISMLAFTDWDPEKAYELLVSRPTTPNRTRKKTPPKRINPLTNRGPSNTLTQSNSSTNHRTTQKLLTAINKGKQIEQEEIDYGLQKSIHDIDLMSYRPTTAQLKDMGLLESSHKNELRMSPRDNEWGMSPRDNELRMSPRDNEWGMSSHKNEWGMSPREMEEQIKALSKMTNKKDTVYVDENSVEYKELHDKNNFDPFMIMGYQNGQPNLLYKTVCKKVNFRYNIFNVETYRCKIFIPREADINDRKFTRYPNPTMLNVDGKTIVNISLHQWANIWNETNDEDNPGQKSLNIYMYNTEGVEEVKGTKDADFTSISLEENPILYMRHGDFGMLYSPDTGVIALDDKEDKPYCDIRITDPSDGRIMILILKFYRNEEDFYRGEEEDFLDEPKLGGKSRRKTRKPRRRRTVRKSFRRKK